jgi:hypothetical protein
MDSIAYVLIVSIMVGNSGSTEVILRANAESCARSMKNVVAFLSKNSAIKLLEIRCDKDWVRPPHFPRANVPLHPSKPEVPRKIIIPVAKKLPPPKLSTRPQIEKKVSSRSRRFTCQRVWHQKHGRRKWYCRNRRR